jgi:hypothetical protein
VTDTNVFELCQPGTFADPLTEVLRNGARALLAQAVEAEVAAWLSCHADKLTDHGRQRLVRHGHHAQHRFDLRSPSQSARLPTPVATKAGPVPTHERLGPDDRKDLQDRWKPAIQLDKEPAIMVGEPDATVQPTLQDNQLMSKHRVSQLQAATST